jgi:peroxiredoxin
MVFAAGCFAQLHPTQRADANLATAPDFSLPSSTGRKVTLADALAHGPAVLVFYRGYW